MDLLTVDNLRNARLDAGLIEAIDRIFFSSSNTKTFTSDVEREGFRERWLGRYLKHDIAHFYVARDAAGEVAGYLAGCLEDPARAPRFTDLGYFQKFAHLTRRFPGHLHVNVAEGRRGGGIGSALVQRFAGDAAAQGCPGIHAVTSRGARNVAFYELNGFHEEGVTRNGAGEVVFLARALA